MDPWEAEPKVWAGDRAPKLPGGAGEAMAIERKPGEAEPKV